MQVACQFVASNPNYVFVKPYRETKSAKYPKLCNAIVGQAFQPDARRPISIKSDKHSQPGKADLRFCVAKQSTPARVFATNPAFGRE